MRSITTIYTNWRDRRRWAAALAAWAMRRPLSSNYNWFQRHWLHHNTHRYYMQQAASLQKQSFKI